MLTHQIIPPHQIIPTQEVDISPYFDGLEYEYPIDAAPYNLIEKDSLEVLIMKTQETLL
jgi:hypothetical protein